MKDKIRAEELRIVFRSIGDVHYKFKDVHAGDSYVAFVERLPNVEFLTHEEAALALPPDSPVKAGLLREVYEGKSLLAILQGVRMRIEGSEDGRRGIYFEARKRTR